MNKKITTALLYGSLFTFGSGAIAQDTHVDKAREISGLRQRDINEQKDKHGNVRNSNRENLIVVDPSDASDPFITESTNRLKRWDESYGRNKARMERGKVNDEKAIKTLEKMESNILRWQEKQDEYKTAPAKDREKIAKVIVLIEKDLVRLQDTYNRQVPRDRMDYKQDLEMTISRINQTEREIESRLAFLNAQEDMLKDMKDQLQEIKDEANNHLTKLNQVDDDSEWAEVKTSIDTWMEENLNMQG